MSRQQQGFTLIEVMIVVVIIGIITSIAVYSFSGSSQDAQRARAMADLASINDALGRYYQTGFSYDGATLADLLVSARLTPTTEYNFAVNIDADGQGYQVTAVPSSTGSQMGDGAILIDSTGRRCFYSKDDSPDFGTCPKSF